MARSMGLSRSPVFPDARLPPPSTKVYYKATTEQALFHLDGATYYTWGMIRIKNTFTTKHPLGKAGTTPSASRLLPPKKKIDILGDNNRSDTMPSDVVWFTSSP